MGKKNKIKDAEPVMEDVVNGQQFDSQPPVKRKSKKHTEPEIDSTVATNGSALDRIKKDKKKKSKGLTAETSSNDKDENTTSENKVKDNESKRKKKKLLKDATAEGDEELVSFKKPNKKRSAEPENLNEDEVPTKVSKADGNLITAGTTIDQLVGVKLKNKKGKREKKREKHTVMVEEQKKKAKEKEREEIRQYLDCWSANREKWKFHKLRQIYIQDHVFDEDEINAELWPITVEYLSGMKGSSKDMLVKRAEGIIREGDAAATEDETLQASSKYERARELLQSLG